MKPTLRSALPAALAICGLHFLCPVRVSAERVPKIESNDTIETAQNLDGRFDTLSSREIGTSHEETSTILPHVTVYGYGNGTLDYYSFTAKQGDRMVFDVDYTSQNFSSMLRVFRPDGTLLADGYPDVATLGAEGSYYWGDAFLELTAPEDGRYTVALGQAYNMEPVPANEFYWLNISAGSPHAQVVKASDLISKELPGIQFTSIGNPAISSSGSIAFQARMKSDQGSVTTANDVAIFAHLRQYLSGSGSSGGGGPTTQRLAIVAREGDLAAGTTDGYFAKFSDPICNSGAVTAFRGYLKLGGSVTKENYTGIWSNQRGTLELVAREGEQAPGTSTGTLFDSFTALVLPDHTGVAFLAKLRTGTGDATSKNNIGIWATDADGNLNLVLRKGNELTYEGVPRTVSSFSIFNSSSGVTGQSRHFTPAGSLLYRARFVGGGTGVFRYLP